MQEEQLNNVMPDNPDVASDADIQDEVNSADQKIIELEKTVANLSDKMIRAVAELDNFRKRSREEIDKASKYAISSFVSDLVLVTENFFLACENMPQNETNQAFQHFSSAVLMTKNELVKVLEKNQVKRIFPLNEKFDHNFHEAIAQEASDLEDGTIIKIVQAGYKISDRLIRPALVVVVKS
jgi:molecular chaperone GrpE